jgi:hypothetical protein
MGPLHQKPTTNGLDVTFRKNGDPMFVVVDLKCSIIKEICVGIKIIWYYCLHNFNYDLVTLNSYMCELACCHLQAGQFVQEIVLGIN